MLLIYIRFSVLSETMVNHEPQNENMPVCHFIKLQNFDTVDIKCFIICFDPSLEPSHRDGSNDGSQRMFSLRNKKNYL